MENNSIKDKIRKLIALSESEYSLGNYAASESAKEKAVKLLYEHGLKPDDIKEPEQYVESNEIPLHKFYNNGSWLYVLPAVIAEYCLCISVRFKNTAKSNNYKRSTTISTVIKFYGKESNVMIAEYLLLSATASFERRSVQLELEENTNGSIFNPVRRTPKRSWILSYLKGCSIGLSKKIKELKEQQPQAEGLILAERENIKNHFFPDGLGKHKSKHKLPSGNDLALYSGLNTGKSHNIQTAIANAQPNQLKLFG